MRNAVRNRLEVLGVVDHVARKGSTEKIMTEDPAERTAEGGCCKYMKKEPRQIDSKCKGPMVAASLLSWRNSKEAGRLKQRGYGQPRSGITLKS